MFRPIRLLIAHNRVHRNIIRRTTHTQHNSTIDISQMARFISYNQKHLYKYILAASIRSECACCWSGIRVHHLQSIHNIPYRARIQEVFVLSWRCAQYVSFRVDMVMCVWWWCGTWSSCQAFGWAYGEHLRKSSSQCGLIDALRVRTVDELHEMRWALMADECMENDYCWEWLNSSRSHHTAA